ncbi:MAG: flagellar filament capping protein FliD [Clostridiales bacterium]|nr:flagellar filament capping protein FliD [Clostridiales bacterium]
MSSINPTYSLLAKTGIGGLVSGMDIDELVYNLTASSREKITKQQQSLQLLEWKQDGYRNVIDALREFQSSYLDLLSAANFRSTGFFNTIKASTESTAVAVTTTAQSYEGTITIENIIQLATNQTIQSKEGVSRGLSTSLTSEDIDAFLGALEETPRHIAINLDGRVKTITFDQDFADRVNTDGFEQALQSAIDDAFGVKDPDDRIIKVSLIDDTLSIEAKGSQVTLNAVGEDSEILELLGFESGQSNKLSLNNPLQYNSFAKDLTPGLGGIYQFSINSVEFKFSQMDSISAIIHKINSSDAGVRISYSSISDTFTLVANESGMGENIFIEETEGNLLEVLGLKGEGASVTYGQNALLTVEGQVISRSSNRVNINGVLIDLLKTSDDPIEIKMTNDATSLMEPIKKFVEDYNAMIDLINGLIKENVYRDFHPLTDEQKEEMTEAQIEKWEEKAKSGVLRGDNILRGLASKMQTLMMSTVEGVGITLHQMGITSAGYQENGKLKIDDRQLEEALKTKSAEITKFFTSEKGLANKLNDLITSYTKTSGVKGQRGILIDVAGLKSTSSENENSIYDKMKRINDNIRLLQERLKNEESRLWRQFTAMETAIQRLNEQSLMLMQFTNSRY